MQPNKTNSEKPIEQRIDIKRKNRANTWISIYTEIEKDDEEQKNQKVDEAIEKTEESLKKLNDDIEQRQKEGVSGEELLDLIDSKLEKLTEGLVVLEAMSKIQLNSAKLEYLRQEQEYIEQKIKDLDKEIEIHEWEEELSEIKSKKYTVYLNELYKSEKDLPIEIIGKQIGIIEDLARLKIQNYEDIAKLPIISREEIESELQEFYFAKETYKKAFKDIKASRAIELMKERYARFKKLESMERDFDKLKPSEMIEYLDILESGLVDILKAFANHEEDDLIIIELANQVGLMPSQIRERRLLEIIREKKQDIWNRLNSISQTEQREQKIFELNKELQGEIANRESELGTIVFLIHQTNFNNEIDQINNIIEDSKPKEEKDLVKMIEDIVDERMKQLEAERKAELNTHIEKRILSSELLIKRRVMEEMAKLEEFAKLYEYPYPVVKQELDKSNLTKELEKKLDQIKYEAETTYAINLSNPDNSDDRERKYIESLESELDKFKKNYLDAIELINQKDKLIESLKLDTKLARLRSEISHLNPKDYSKLKSELNAQPIKTVEDVDKLLQLQVFQQNESLQFIQQSLSKSFADIDYLFSANNYQISPSPNGLVVGFKDADKYYSGILGEHNVEKINVAESISNVLKSNESVNILSQKVLNNQWNGNITLATSYNGENDLASIAQRTIWQEMDLDQSKDEEKKVINIAIENLAINIGQGALNNEEVVSRAKEELIAQLTGLTPDKLAKIPEDKREQLKLDLNILINIANEIATEEKKQQQNLTDETAIVLSNQAGPLIAEKILQSTSEDGTYDIKQATQRIVNEIPAESNLKNKVENISTSPKESSSIDNEVYLSKVEAQIKDNFEEQNQRIISQVEEKLNEVGNTIKTSKTLNEEAIKELKEELLVLEGIVRQIPTDTASQIQKEIESLNILPELKSEISKIVENQEKSSSEFVNTLENKLDNTATRLEQVMLTHKANLEERLGEQRENILNINTHINAIESSIINLQEMGDKDKKELIEKFDEVKQSINKPLYSESNEKNIQNIDKNIAQIRDFLESYNSNKSGQLADETITNEFSKLAKLIENYKDNTQQIVLAEGANIQEKIDTLNTSKKDEGTIILTSTGETNVQKADFDEAPAESKITHLTTQPDIKQDKVKEELTSEIEKLKEEIGNLKTQFEKSEGENENKLSTLQSQLEDIGKDNQSKTEEIEQLKSQISQLQKLKEEEQQKIDNIEQEPEDQTIKEALTDDTKQIQEQKVEELEKEISRLQNKISELENKSAQETGQIEKSFEERLVEIQRPKFDEAPTESKQTILVNEELEDRSNQNTKKEIDWNSVSQAKFDDELVEPKQETRIDWDQNPKVKYEEKDRERRPVRIDWSDENQPKQPVRIRWDDNEQLPPNSPPPSNPKPTDRNFAEDGGLKSGVVSIADYRGRPNVMWDHKMDKVSGTQRMDTVGGALANELPFGLSGLYRKITNKDRGPIEYEVANDFGSLKNPLNFKFRSAGWGGILAKVPIINKLIYPPKTQFGSSFEKIIADIPPFGRGWEQIVKELNLFPKLRENIKKNFPPWEQPLETTTPNSTEMWNQTYKIAIENLGKDGIFLSQDQIKRIMGEHPITVFEVENGQLKFDMSRQNLDSIGPDGLHRGRITNEFLNGISDDNSEFIKIANDGIDEKIIGEAIRLANKLNKDYDKNNFPYTINDLIKATHMCHDLGLNVQTGDIRHPQYEEKYQLNGQKYSKVEDPNFGIIMKSQFTWYNPQNPNKRGIVINGETFSLDGAHELLRKYNIYFTYKSLKDGVPTITPLMQQNMYEPNITARVSSPHTRNMVESILKRRGVPESQYGRFLGVNGSVTAEQIQLLREEIALIAQAGNSTELQNYKKNLEAALLPFTTLEGRIRDNYAWAWDETLQKHFVHEVKQDSSGKGIRNKFFSGGMQGIGIPGVNANPKLAREWLMKTTGDVSGLESALKQQYTLVDNYYNLIGVAHRYMQKSKLSKTFWGDTKLWTQRFGNLGMGLCLAGSFFTGMPIFGAYFFIIAGLQAFAVYNMQYQEKLMAGRNKSAQTQIANLFGQKGAFDSLLNGPISRADFARMENLYGGIEGAVTDIASEPIPAGSFPKGDNAVKVWDTIFGEKGLINQGIGKMQK